MKAVHIFHHNDLDGKASASLMYEYFKKYRCDIFRYFFHEIDYTVILDQEIFPQDVVVFVDYSFSTSKNINYLIGLINDGHEVIWIDHHASSLEIISFNENFKKAVSLNNMVYYHINISKCATWLVYEYIKSKISEDMIFIMPDIIYYVNSHDMWKL